MACEEGMETGGFGPSNQSPDHIHEEQKDAQDQSLWLQGLTKKKEDRVLGRLTALFRPQLEEDVRQD